MHGKNAFTILVDETQSAERLDVFVSSCTPECSRSRFAFLIRRGVIQVNGATQKPGYRVRTGDRICGFIPPPEPSKCLPEAIPIDIIYADHHLIIVNKPAGMVVHPAPGHYSGTLVNALLHHFPELQRVEEDLRPGVVHRLDKDTSGVLVIAKTIACREDLLKQFQTRTIQKQYLALVYGKPKADSGKISLPIGRHPRDHKRMSTISRKGRQAETIWHVRERFNGISFLEIDLKTGRTHQIRVHLTSMHHPIVGDPVYGDRKGKRTVGLFDGDSPGETDLIRRIKSIQRQMLHARRIKLIHPASGKEVSFTAPLPADMAELIEILGKNTRI